MSDLLTSPICLNQPNKQGGNSIYRIYIYKYIYIYIFLSCHCCRPYFSFSMRTKLRKALYQTRMKLLTCFYGKILFDTYILPL